jgi:hypothetical protein
MTPEQFERILARRVISPTGCWLWPGADDGRGYGQVNLGRRSAAGNKLPEKVHRAVWEHVNGPIPPDRELHHDCRVTLCFRPDEEHVALELTPAAHAALHAAERTHCRNGHERTPENVRIDPRTGQRYCRPCHREDERRRRRRRYPARNECK